MSRSALSLVWHYAGDCRLKVFARVVACAALVILMSSSFAAAQTAISAELVAAGLPRVTAITHAGDGSGRLFITLQVGRIVIFDGSQVLAPDFLDITSIVLSGGERGLLGAAFHPDYAINGFFYVNYTDVNGDTVVARYSVSGNPNVADQGSATTILTVEQPFANHNGGQLQFGPDGLLYIAMGDGGGGGDPQNNAHNLGNLLGKILAIDVDGGVPYAIPPDNPFVGVPGAREEIWAYGLRNPWRFSFDRLTGDIFIADVGQNQWEEVNFQPAISAGGKNYGWRLMEGKHCFDPPTNCNNGSLTLPVIEYSHSLGRCSVTGGYRYRGVDNPNLPGIYFFADFCTGEIWGMQEDGFGVWVLAEQLDTDFAISTFGEDESGELYFAHFSSVDGAIYRIASIPPLSVINLESPANESILASPPIFTWTPDGGTNNTYAVDFAPSIAGPVFSTRENLSLTINDPSWTMPARFLEDSRSRSCRCAPRHYLFGQHILVLQAVERACPFHGKALPAPWNGGILN
jgi:hypothetical protein